MTRSKLSTKVLLMATGIGLSTAAFAGSRPVAAQNTVPAYYVALGACPAGTVYDPTYECSSAGWNEYGYYYGDPYGAYGTIRHWGAPLDHHHSFGHAMGGLGLVDRGVSVAHFGGDGFADRGVNVAHLGLGGFAHGLGVAHVGGFEHVGGGFGGFHSGGGVGHR